MSFVDNLLTNIKDLNTNLQIAADAKVDDLFKDATIGAVAKIEGSKVTLPPVPAAGGATTLDQREAALPSYALPLAIIAIVGIFFYGRK